MRNKRTKWFRAVSGMLLVAALAVTQGTIGNDGADGRIGIAPAAAYAKDGTTEGPAKYRPAGGEMEVLETIPGLDYMIQVSLKGSDIYGKYAKNSLTLEEQADIADSSHGVSLIGVSALGYKVEGVCDGIWRPWDVSIEESSWSKDEVFGSTLSWYPAYGDDGTAVRYNVDGEAGTTEEHRYLSLLTYHFAEEMDFTGFAFVERNKNQFPQAGDVYVSSNGTDWTLLGGWDRSALRQAKKDYLFHDTYEDYMARQENCVMLGFSLAGVKGSYLRFGFTSGHGRNTDDTAYEDLTNSAFNPITLRELAVFGNEKKIWGREETLYNGIVLPEGWIADDLEGKTRFYPAVPGFASDHTTIEEPKEMPYLKAVGEGGTRPDVIDVTVGRQLFVDDFLIEETDLEQNYHTAEKYENNPVLSPQEKWERGRYASTAMMSGGVWYDMEEKLFKMWYTPAIGESLAYATSTDGINWTRPALNEDGSSLLQVDNNIDVSAVWIDYDAPASERYKLLDRVRGRSYPAYLYVSADGINWERLPADTPPVEDKSSFFYNPFRKKWILSAKENVGMGRVRTYAETDDFTDGWQGQKQVLWLRPDTADKPDEEWQLQPQLYGFDAVGYESIMIGMFQIWLGPENDYIEAHKIVKICELEMTYSRDGFNWERPDRTPFIAATRQDGDKDKGYLQPAAGGVIVFEDELWFYYSGFSGEYTIGDVTEKGTLIGGTISLAKLRRDGFASLDGSGTVLTRPLTADGGKKYLFVNVDAPEGTLRAEIIGADGTPVPGYTMEDCLAVSGDTTKSMVSWKGGADVSFLNGSEFRIRFEQENGRFYSFWLSRDEEGGSDGATAAGLVNAADYEAANTVVTIDAAAEETEAETGSSAAADGGQTVSASADGNSGNESEAQTADEDQKSMNGQQETGGPGPLPWIAAAAVIAAICGIGLSRKRKKEENL